MKDNHGWGLNTMIGFCCVIGACLMVVAILYNFYMKDKIDDALSNPNVGNTQDVTSKEYEKNYYDEQSVDSTIIIQKTYDDILKEMEVAANTYVNKYYSGMVDGTVKITLDSLVENKMLEYVYDPNDDSVKCNGYVMYNKENANKSFKPYLKCGTYYQTEGYQG